MAFINTIDLLGDAVVMDALISRTITEYNDDVLTNLSQYAFASNSELLKVRLPSLYVRNANTTGWRFMNCPKLHIADVGKTPVFAHADFSDCISLVAVILRYNDVVIYGNAFYNTPIAAGTGYIYVPRALVDSYKAATNWSNYGDQYRAIEDYTVDGTLTGDIDETKIWA